MKRPSTAEISTVIVSKYPSPWPRQGSTRPGKAGQNADCHRQIHVRRARAQRRPGAAVEQGADQATDGSASARLPQRKESSLYCRSMRRTCLRTARTPMSMALRPGARDGDSRSKVRAACAARATGVCPRVRGRCTRASPASLRCGSGEPRHRPRRRGRPVASIRAALRATPATAAAGARRARRPRRQ